MIKKPASLHGLRDLLAAQGYDVLTDVRMPKRDGFEVCRELRTAEATRLTPVILVTGAAETDDLDSAEAVLRSLALTIEARDAYTEGHCVSRRRPRAARDSGP